MRILPTLIVMLPLCFAGGWVIGSADFASIKKAVADSYINRYNAVTGNNVDEIIYYVITDNQDNLDQMAINDANILKVSSAGYPRMYNVHLGYSERRESLKKLRQLSNVTAVFTVPFICH